MYRHIRNKKFWVIWFCAMVCLLFSYAAVRARSRALEKTYSDNNAALHSVMPSFNEGSLKQLKDDVYALKSSIVGLNKIFYPRDSWLKKDYDVSILFVEDLNNINQALKKRAEEKKLNVVSLDFASKLPSGEEAVYLLTQLKGLKGLVNTGLELGGNFSTVKPLAVERVEGVDDVRVIKSFVEGVFPSETAMEFLAQVREIVPKLCLESLSIKTQESGVILGFTAGNILTDTAWQEKEHVVAASIRENQQQEIQQAISVIRSTNPFVVIKHVEPPVPEANKAAQETKPAQRFFYRGKAVLRGVAVAVVEDTLSKETVFLKKEEVYKDFKLNDFTLNEVVIENLTDGVVTTIKRGG